MAVAHVIQCSYCIRHTAAALKSGATGEEIRRSGSRPRCVLARRIHIRRWHSTRTRRIWV
ncbi:hypothetical protein [Caballeronia glebae]|uniref:hypothetical protein n=1 Tax=Caballeronia glebae TaxID=1777143 RepID=UPI002E154B7B